MSAQVIDRKTSKSVTIPEAIPLRGGEQDGDTFISTVQYVKPGDPDYAAALDEWAGLLGYEVRWQPD